VQGAVSLPLFVDGPAPSSRPYTGVSPSGSQLTGFAQRITVNQAVVDDKSLLVKHAPTTLAGDPARPQALLDGLTKAQRTFTAATGVGGMNQPYAGTAADFARRVVETRGAQSELASRMHEGQQVALATIETRFAESAAVNIDQEMAQLVQLQTAYGANARVMTAVRDMLDMLMRI
jgi:flagellar hook-associated protein 1 FlgK